ncbi:MAG: hypothetical protein ACO307_05240, partial [Ilumatobacteraceae bacterium]
MSTEARSGRRSMTSLAAMALVLVPSVAVAGVLRADDEVVPARRAPSGDPGPVRSGLQIAEQSWATAPGGSIRLVLDIVRSDLVPPTTTTTTTTSSTTTTTTSTISPPTSTTSTTVDVDASPGDAASDVGTTTSSAPSTTIPPPAYRVQVRAHRRLETREQAVAAVDGSHGLVIDLVELDLDESRLEQLEDGTRRLVLEIPVTTGDPDADALDIVESGVHPITTQIRRDSIPIAEITTFVELVAPNTRRGPFGIAAVAAVADPGPDATMRDLAAAFDAIDDIGELADRIPHPVTFAIPPGVLAALSERAPERLARFREQVDRDDTAIVLPSEPFDPSSAAAAGLTDDFATRMDLGESTIGSLLPDVPTTRDVWLVDERLTAEGAALLRDVGVELFVVPFDRYASWLDGSSRPMDPRYTDTTLLVGADLGIGDEVGAIVDLAIVDPVLDLVSDTDDRSPLERAVEIMTLTSTTRLELGPDLRGMVLITPDLGVADPAVVTELARLSASHPEYSWQDASRVGASTNSFFVGG